MKTVKRILIVIIALAIWELIAYNNSTFKFLMSSPSSTITYAFDNFPQLIQATSYTFIEAFGGFLIAVILSFGLMLLCILYPFLLKKIQPLIIVSQILPMITLVPIFIVLFGMGMLSKIAMVVLMCFFPVFINFSSGIRNISPNIHDLLYIYNTPKRYSIFKIILPLSTPFLFTGLKISTTMAIMGAIVAEFMGTRIGLGKNLYLAPKSSKADLMVCSVILTIILGLFLYYLIDFLEKKKGNWYLEADSKNVEFK